MKTTFFRNDDIRSNAHRANELPTTTICDGYHITGKPDFNQLLDFYRQISQNNPQYRHLLILDDRDQASYTSMHCNEFDYSDSDDDSDDDETWLPSSKWGNRLANFQNALNDEFPQLDEATLLANDNFSALTWNWEAWQLFADLLKHPTRAVRFHDDNYLFCAPVSHSWELVAVMPNGYWAGDLSPTENALFSAVMERKFGYRLFGIGSNLLGFVRDGHYSSEQAQALADWLMDVFKADDAEDDDGNTVNHARAQICREIVPLIERLPYLFVSYSENAFELFGE